MISRLARIQLVAFLAVSVAAVIYGSITLLDVGSVVRPPYLVEAQFAQPGGIHPRADVDLLGTNVGRVEEVRPGPGTGTTVVLAINSDVEISREVSASISSKSAIGEQYVALTPMTAGGPSLEEGDVIPLERTVSPPDFAELLRNTSELVSSVSVEDLGTVLDEMTLAFDGVAPALGGLLDDSNTVTRASLDNVEALTSLIENAQTVLDTQVAVGPQTTTYLRELAGLTDRLRELDTTFDRVFVHGISAGTELTNLLAANQKAIPFLLNNLLTVTDVAADRVPGLRKTLVVFPWVLELAATGARWCDTIDPKTGPVESTCHYDEQGNRIFSAHLAAQLPEEPGDPPYAPCTKGYEGTVRYHPDGVPVDGGPRQRRDSDPNPDARCAAPPTDPFSPNVRGAQNAHEPHRPPARGGLAMMNPSSGVVATPDGMAYRIFGTLGDPPPEGPDGLGWLLLQPFAEASK